MNFRSDNTAPVAPEILAALNEANVGTADAYSEDAWSRRLDETFSHVFEREVRVFTVAYSNDADVATLRRIAQSTDATAYDSRDTADLADVLPRALAST